jgi:hypothetical protein
MYFNTILNNLAKERTARTTTPVNEEWSCPVCYTDGSSSGLVIPKCCSHKVCLDCYSNILTKTNNCICPVCRAEYRPQQVTAPAPAPTPATNPVRRILVIKNDFYFGAVGGSITIGDDSV